MPLGCRDQAGGVGNEFLRTRRINHEAPFVEVIHHACGGQGIVRTGRHPVAPDCKGPKHLQEQIPLRLSRVRGLDRDSWLCRFRFAVGDALPVHLQQFLELRDTVEFRLVAAFLSLGTSSSAAGTGASIISSSAGSAKPADFA